MPTSTVWKTVPGVSRPRLTSPGRPLNSDIERLSPEPPDTPRTHHRNHFTTTRIHPSNPQLYGLGLSEAITSEDLHNIAQPDHLYIDQNGGAHVAAKLRSASHTSYSSDQRRDGRRNNTQNKPTDSKSTKSRGHTRSGSTIDDLANIAIATSPTFHNNTPTFTFNGSPRASQPSRPSTSYINGYAQGESTYDRPAKRVRSEKLRSAEWSPRDERPRTSHALPYQSRAEDAELLLGLRNGYSFSTHASPVATLAQPVPLEELSTNTRIALPNQQDKPDEEEILEKEPTIVAEIPMAPQAPGIAEEFTTDPMDVDHQPEQDTVRQEPIIEHKKGSEEKSPSDPVQTSEQNSIPLNPRTAPVEPESKPAPNKKPRKVKPDVQAEACAECQKMQQEMGDEDTTTLWFGCEKCNRWFHAPCAGFKDKVEARSVDKFICKQCELEHGKTTFVRKSSRARTAIDYAGLNEGVVKSSVESTMHHYIHAFKDGKFKLQPDDFARIRPELLTADFWENMDGMKRPFVVPACWNPRFGAFDSQDLEPTAEQSTVTDEQVKSEPSRITSNLNEQGTLDHETVIDCDQDYLDMVIPRDLTVRKVAHLYGPEQMVPVIDVKSQGSKYSTLGDWADYYELDGEKPIRNVISLEVSNSPLGRLIRRPKVVRDIDLEDQVWDIETKKTSDKRPVQFYCLMSVADSYTDFHIDFGGSSVYYHILKGVKTFFFIPPEDRYLKKYEEWCNSDTQGETWLGDLCGDNVTRVDLHEGDTAFIPAGWIHSVWTPEDSLVIGGNFLTRLDYDMQLKVTNIEKATKVSLKFRYPFFQKVMWYSLLKYLDEDPVPDEVLRDFHEDQEHRFLRANPIWHDVGDEDEPVEGGDPAFNARVYPKSELKGLPALRDYLYRTARIHADLPVSDINQKQVAAVKRSIPTGFGDPMQLIKTFAVWCAWKTGNEIVPEWVHSDTGLSNEVQEREKVKKPEPFRVPPERVSARKASQASQARNSNPPEETTPVKAVTPDGDDLGSKKPRSGSKGSSLRVACDACRKRRIKCRHKEDDASPSNASPAAIRPRTYSNVSVEIPNLASISPVNTNFEQPSNASSETPNSSDLAQAALTSLHSQSSDAGQTVISAGTPGSAKKGRSKACEECRKSKRRCVHDEYGRVDPAKAAEPSKPRGSSNAKRPSRTSDENPFKKIKMEMEADGTSHMLEQTMDIDAMIDPALMSTDYQSNILEQHATLHEMNSDINDHVIYAFEPETINGIIDPALEDDTFTISAEGEPDGTHNETAQQTSAMSDSATKSSPEPDISYSPITVDGHPAEVSEKLDSVATAAMTAKQNTPVQPRDADRLVEHTAVPKQARIPRRDSSSGVSVRTTIESTNTRRSSSNTSGTTHQAGMASVNSKRESSTRALSRESTTGSDADERLARELQAAENGLRRRTSMRA